MAVPHEIELAAGAMRVRNTPLFLDAQRPAELGFVSHAHSDHIARHRQTVATAATLKLLAQRLGPVQNALPAPYKHSFNLGNLALELVPAGHVLGSAQIVVTRPDGKRLGYTGDFNPVPSLMAEPAEIAFCDVLVMESTFGHPRYRFPPREETYEAMRQWARAALDERVVPVFLAYSLGKSQEAMKALLDGGFALCAHSSISQVCEVYEQLGKPLPHRRFDGEVRPGEVLFFPPNLAQSRALEHLGRRRTAMLSGWALDSGAKYRFGVDEAFPLSDHADFEGLATYAQQTGAKKVLTVHGFAKELAACLRDRGIDAQPLEPPKQMELF